MSLNTVDTESSVSPNREIDISCLTQDRDVHHTLRYKSLFNGDVSKLDTNLSYMCIRFELLVRLMLTRSCIVTG